MNARFGRCDRRIEGSWSPRDDRASALAGTAAPRRARLGCVMTSKVHFGPRSAPRGDERRVRAVRGSLAGSRAAVEGNPAPAVAVREGGRQAQNEAAHRGEDLDADLQQIESQRGDLRAGPRGAARGETQ